eukprot:scaffold436_cov367-Prasinococcus_capsulatus_cf.AAC.2
MASAIRAPTSTVALRARAARTTAGTEGVGRALLVVIAARVLWWPPRPRGRADAAQDLLADRGLGRGFVGAKRRAPGEDRGGTDQVLRVAAARPARAVVACSAGSRRDVLNFAALSVASGLLAARPALAEEEEVAEAAADVSPLVAALLEKTEANKELNDKKRLATSYANFARSRTIAAGATADATVDAADAADGTCAFPDNLIGCENKAEMGVRPVPSRPVAGERAAREQLGRLVACCCWGPADRRAVPCRAVPRGG